MDCSYEFPIYAIEYNIGDNGCYEVGATRLEPPAGSQTNAHRGRYVYFRAGEKRFDFLCSPMFARGLREAGWAIDVETLALPARRGTVQEVSVDYRPRTAKEGKKIHWFDGFSVAAATGDRAPASNSGTSPHKIKNPRLSSEVFGGGAENRTRGREGAPQPSFTCSRGRTTGRFSNTRRY